MVVVTVGEGRRGEPPAATWKGSVGLAGVVSINRRTRWSLHPPLLINTTSVTL